MLVTLYVCNSSTDTCSTTPVPIQRCMTTAATQHADRRESAIFTSEPLLSAQQHTGVTETYQPQQSVCIEDKISLVSVDIPDNGMHAPGLEIAGHNLKVVIDAA